MDKDSQLWNEYSNLHQEIRFADQLNFQVMGGVIAAVALILTAGIEHDSPLRRLFTYLCVYVVTLPAYMLLQGNRKRIWRITGYIRVFLEPQLAYIGWESALADLYSLASQKGRGRLASFITRNEALTIIVLNGFAALAQILVLIRSRILDYWVLVSLGLGLCWAVSSVWLFLHGERLARGRGIETQFLEEWRELRARRGEAEPVSNS